MPTERAGLATHARAQKGSTAGGDSHPRARARSRVASRVEAAGLDARLRGGSHSAPRSAPLRRLLSSPQTSEKSRSKVSDVPTLPRFPQRRDRQRLAHNATRDRTTRGAHDLRGVFDTRRRTWTASRRRHARHFRWRARETAKPSWHPRATNNDRLSSSDCLPCANSSSMTEKRLSWFLLALLPAASLAAAPGASAPFPSKESISVRDVFQIARPSADHDSLEVVASGVRRLESLEEKISVVAIVGGYHSGKSFMLNALNESFGTRDFGFEMTDSHEPTTRGLWLGLTDMTSEVDGSRVALLDTEGFSSAGVAESYDAQIFSVAALLASHLVYNSRTLITAAEVEYLETLARRAHLWSLTTRVGGESTKKTGTETPGLAAFPPLTWAVQDFGWDLRGADPTSWLASFMGGAGDEKHSEKKSTPKNTPIGRRPLVDGNYTLRELFRGDVRARVFAPPRRRARRRRACATAPADFLDPLFLAAARAFRGELLRSAASRRSAVDAAPDAGTRGASLAARLRTLVDAARAGGSSPRAPVAVVLRLGVAAGRRRRRRRLAARESIRGRLSRPRHRSRLTRSRRRSRTRALTLSGCSRRTFSASSGSGVVRCGRRAARWRGATQKTRRRTVRGGGVGAASRRGRREGRRGARNRRRRTPRASRRIQARDGRGSRADRRRVPREDARVHAVCRVARRGARDGARGGARARDRRGERRLATTRRAAPRRSPRRSPPGRACTTSR